MKRPIENKAMLFKPHVVRRMQNEVPEDGWTLDELCEWFCDAFPVLSRQVPISALKSAAEAAEVLTEADAVASAEDA